MKTTVTALSILLTAGASVLAQPPGSFDVAAANRLLTDYMQHVNKRLPRDWRQLEEKRMREEPPHLDATGIYQIMAPEGQIGFEYDAQGGTQRVHDPRTGIVRIT